MYEFEIPNSLVGLVIGIKGKTIRVSEGYCGSIIGGGVTVVSKYVYYGILFQELSSRTDVRMLIRQHHAPEKVDTHQICQVRGFGLR